MRKAALERDPETREQYITLAARKTVAAAVQGDIAAAKELGDRLDGKPHQTNDLVITDNRMVEAPPPAPDASTWQQKYGPH